MAIPVARIPVLLLGCFGFLATLFGQPTNVAVLPVPEWVKPTQWTPPATLPGEGQSEATRLLLYERQDRLRESAVYTRIVQRMENEAGVQDAGSLSFRFNPAFQRLTLHHVRIHRNGTVLERLDPAKIKVIQPEPGLFGHVLTGEQTAVVLVTDLRVGDVLEHAQTLHGANPVLGGHYFNRLMIQSVLAMDRQRLRVLWPAGRPLHLRLHLNKITPRQTTTDGETEYLWDLALPMAIPFEDGTPPGHEPFPYVELSDLDAWSDVVKWALPLYALGDVVLPPELLELIAKWRAGSTSDEERALRALQFVQDEVRYTGLELGADSHRPASPAETFRLRYGDCKGKVALLCAIFKELKLESYPALVNTLEREAIVRRLPSPLAFNHVIVKLLLAGRTAWLDPTASRQGGRLFDRAATRLGHALVVQPGGTALEVISEPVNDLSSAHVTSTFRMQDYTAPVSLAISTVYRGALADTMREGFARSDQKEPAQGYLNYRARYYPGIRGTNPPVIADDRDANRLTVTEQYEIRDLWRLNSQTRRWEAAFHAESLNEMLPEPHTRLRVTPFALPHPLRREHEVVVHLPGDRWNVPDSREVVEHDAFSYRHERKLTGSILRSSYRCETKASAVAAANVAGYLEKLKEMHNDLGDTFFRPDRSAQATVAGTNWLMVVVAGFGLLASLALCLRVWRDRPPLETETVPEFPSSSPLRGLGGWLIVVGFGLCATLFTRLGILVKNWDGYFSAFVWQDMAVSTGTRFHPLFGPVLILELLAFLLVLVVNGLLIALYFAKRRPFPKVYLAWVIGNAVLVVADSMAAQAIPGLSSAGDGQGARDIAQAFTTLAIWGSYMVKSQRVKLTFVN